MVNILFLNLKNQNEKVYSIIDCHGINLNRPWKYRTNAGNAVEKLCYFNVKSSDKPSQSFLIKRRKSLEKDSEQIYFQIEKVISRSKNADNFNYH